MAADFLEEARRRVASGQTKNQLSPSAGQSDSDFLAQARQRVSSGQTRNQLDTVKNTQADRAIQATFSQTGVGERPQATLVQKATGGLGRTSAHENRARKLDRVNNRANAARNELTSRLAEETASGQPILDPVRDKLKGLEQQQAALEAQREKEKAEAWEQKQKAAIDATGNSTLMQDLQKLHELESQVKAYQGMVSMGGNIPEVNQAVSEYLALQQKLKDQYGKELDNWKAYASRVGNREMAEQVKAETAAAAKENWAGMTLARAPINAASGIGFVDANLQKAQRLLTGSDAPIDYNTPAMQLSQMSNAITEGATERIEEDTAGKWGSDTALGNVYSGLYNLGVSMGDSVIGMATGTSVLMAGAAATNAMVEAKERGATDNQALLFGLAAGAMEGVMEKASIDSLFNMADPKTTKQLVLNVLKQGGVEASEEVLTTVANTVADAIIMGNKNQLTTAINDYIEEGHNPEEAEKMAMKDWGSGLVMDAIGGLISGGTFEAVRGSAGYIGNNLQNQQQNKAASVVETEAEKSSVNTAPEQPVPQDLTENKKTTASETITGSPINGPERSNAAVGAENNIAQEASPFNDSWQKFMDKHKGQPSVSDYLAFGRQIDNEADAEAFVEFLDQQERDGLLKWRSDGAPGRVMPAEDHIDRRDYGSVGDRKVKSFQYNNPEVQPYFREGLEIFGEDLSRSLPGERYYNGLDPNGVGSQGKWSGQKRHTTPEIAMLKDDYRMSWGDIDKAYEDLLKDAGRENNANAKRLELVIDKILTEGHRTLGGVEVPPNQGYIETKSKIDGYAPKAKATSAIDDDFMRHEFGDSFEENTVDARTDDVNHDTLPPSQAQAFNIMAANIVAEARKHNIPLEEYYKATQEINAFSPTKADVKLVSNLLEPVVRQLDEKSFYGYLDKMRSYSGENALHEDKKSAMGAADYGFSPYSNYQNTQSDFLPEGANAARPVDMPTTDPTGRPTRRGAKTLYGAEITSDDRAVQMELEFMQGVYGYDRKTNQDAVDRANATLEEEGYDRTYAKVVERLRDLKDLKQTMTEAILLYNDAIQNGNDADAAELALLMSMSGTEGGQLVQTFSMFRQLTPEGQLAGTQRVVDRINDKTYGKRKDGNPIPKHQQESVENTVDEVRETALRLLESIHQAFSGDNRDHGVPVENWIAEIGDKLAKTIDANKTGRQKTANPTLAKTIQKDLERFAKGYMDKVRPGNQYSNAKALENFLNNPDQYSEAWDTARQTLREKYKNNPEMLTALNDFIENGIGLEQIGRGIDNDIQKALSDIGEKTSELIRTSDADKTVIAGKITEMLMSDHQLSETDANTMATFILERFNQYVAERSEAALSQRFRPKDKKQRKTFNQDFTELANMGAFTNANWKDAVSQKLFGHEITIDPDLIQQFRNAPDQPTRDTIMEQIYENVGQQIPTTFGEAANQWRYMSMLLAPSTHLKNMGGNISMMAMKLGKDAIGAGIETVANAATKGKTGRTKSILNVFSKNDQRLMQQAWADFENVREDVKGIGKHKDNATGKVGEHRDYWKLNNPEGKVAKALDATLRAAEKVPKFNSDLMDLEDQWFSQPDYAISLAGYMKANKLTEITPEARTYAIKEAQKATFRDANAVSEFAKRAGNTNSKLWNGIVNTIFPFKGTPANVGVRAVEYSPVGFFTTIGKAIKASNEGTFKATDFIDDLSANFVGSGLAVAGYFLAQAGLLRATGVGDEKEKEAQREAGYKDNSFTLFGYSIPETVFTSASAPMFIGAALYEALATKALDNEAYTIDDVLQALSTTVDPILGQTMLDGLSDILYSVRSTQGGVGEFFGSLGINIVGNYLASYIPTLLSRVSAAVDGVSRETYTDKNKPLPKVQKEIQDLMMKTPLRAKLPEKVDNYGRTQENWLSDADTKVGKALGAAMNVVTPTFPSKIQTTDVEAAMQELYRSGADTSDKKVFQTDAPKYITVDGEKVNLTAEQHEKLEKIRGENTVHYQSGLQDNDAFERLPKEMQVYATDKMYDFVEQKSKMAMGVGYEPDSWVYDLQNASPEKVSEVIVQKAVESMAEDKRLYDNKYAGIADMLDAHKINDTIALAVMSDTAVDGYVEYCKNENVSVADYAEVCGYMNKVNDLGKTLEYIDKMDMFKREKIALAQAIHYANPKIIRTDNPVSEDWLLEHGATDAIVEQFSESRKKLYDTYIQDKGVDMKDYLAIYNFKNTEKENADGEMKKPKQDEVIAEIDKLKISKEAKRNLFLSLDYAQSKIPYWWR